MVCGYFELSRNESAPKSLFSLPTDNIVSVLRLEAVFSIIEKGYPAFTRVAFIKLDPKSKPIKLADTPGIAELKVLIAKAARSALKT